MNKDELQTGVAITTLGTLSIIVYSFAVDKMILLIDLKEGSYSIKLILSLFSLASIIIITSGLLYLVCSYLNRDKKFTLYLLIMGISYFLVPIGILFYYLYLPFPYPIPLHPFNFKKILEILLQVLIVFLILLLPPLIIFKLRRLSKN